MDRAAIERMIPHRAPFLLLDSVEYLTPGTHCVAVMSLQSVGPIFAGHFPGRPILPGVLMIEAVAQTTAVMMAAAQTGGTVDNALLAAVNRFKFLKPVTPDQEVRIETKTLTSAGTMSYIGGTVFANGVIVATGELSVVCA